MISINDIRTIVLANIPIAPVKGGRMYRDGTRYGEDAVKFSVVYDGNMVPYIAPQEYGFTHYLSGKFVTVNQGFIQNDTVNALDFLINNATSKEKNLILAQSKRTAQARANQLSQGTLQSLKGNNR